MKRIIVTAGISILAVSFFSNAFPQDVDLDTVVVTAARIGQESGSLSRSVDVLHASDIEQSGAQDVAQALEGVTGLSVSDYGGWGASKTLRMRGATAAQTLVMIDGRPVNSPRDGEIDMSTVPLDSVDRIEILHGPGSSLYGSNAMGGVVNILTKNPPREGFKTEMTSGFGTFRTYLDRVNHGGRIGRFAYHMSGTYESSVGFRDNAKVNQKDCNAKLQYDLTQGNTITVNSGFFRSLLGAAGTLSAPDTDDKQRTYKNFVDAWWDFRPDNMFGVKVKIYNMYDRLEFMENSAGSAWDIANTKNIHTTTVHGCDFQFDKQFVDFYRFLGGFNYVANYNDSTSSGKHAYSVKGWYFDNQFDITKKAYVSLGARIEDYSTFGFEANPSATFMYRLNDKTKIRSAISRSFRAPTFNDLYWPDDGWTKGNQNLKPEKGITGEMGIERDITRQLTSGLTYYHSQFKQMIAWTETNWVWSPNNIGSAQINGIELTNRISFNENYSAIVNYSWMHAKDNRTKKYLIYQPNNKADVSLKYTNDGAGVMIELNGHYTDRRFHDAANATYVKRFFVFGLSASKKINKSFTCFASIDNLFNRKYQVIRDYPVPGFSLNGGLKAEF